MLAPLRFAVLLLVGASVMACTNRIGSQPSQAPVPNASTQPATPASPNTPGASQSVTLTPQSHTFNVTRGQTFSVGLKSAGSGGYRWYVDQTMDQAVVRLKGQRTGEMPKDAPLGVFADEIFDFEAVGAGQVTLSFTMYRPWEGPTKSVESRKYPVMVK